MKKYNLTFLLFIFIASVSCAQVNKENYYYVGFYNVQNLFDTVDDPLINDAEFLPESEIQWTQERLDKKMHDMARVIRSMNNNEGPDVLGLCEIENAPVLQEMLDRHLKDLNYRIAHIDSPDGRGIDVCLIYKYPKFQFLKMKGDTVLLGGDFHTRLIFRVDLLTEKKDTLHFFVNHWPSRRGGEKESEPRRIKSAQVLRNAVDEIVVAKPDAKIILMGDFNDEPNNASIKEVLKAAAFNCTTHVSLTNQDYLLNLSYSATARGEGSYKFQNQWNMIDQIIVSQSLFDSKGIDYKCESYEIYRPDFLVTRSGRFEGAPFPTYGGQRYLGGYSDHFAIIAKFYTR